MSCLHVAGALITYWQWLEEVVKWAQKCPAQEGDIIEVREIFDFETK